MCVNYGVTELDLDIIIQIVKTRSTKIKNL